jgi:outer membrane protein assembly factor BamB
MTSRAYSNWLAWGLTPLLACSGCREASPIASRALPLTIPAKLFAGGDADAWLTANGDLGDSSYCDAPLILPLESEPVWEYSYTAAEIGQQPPNSLVHFDGTIAGCAMSNVVFLLDAMTGKEVLKQNMYVAKDSYAIRQEGFFSLMFGPSGKLAAVDTLGRYNIWNPSAETIERIGLSEEDANQNQGYVLLQDRLVGQHKRLLAAVPATDPSQALWTDQLIFLSTGVVAARDGTIVAWTQRGTVVCIDGQGTETWRSEEGSLMHRVVLDPREPLVYIAPRNGKVICRHLKTGEERWRYDYSDLMPALEREARRRQLLAIVKDETYERGLLRELKLMPVALCVTPTGLFIAFQSGDCVLLDGQGQPRWHTAMRAMADGAIAFQNGVLLHLTYEPLGIARLSRVGAEYLPFLLEPPDWPELGHRDRLRQLNEFDFLAEQEPASSGSSTKPALKPIQVVFGQFVVLDLNTGKVIHVEAEGSAVAGGPFLPAQARFVVALERSDNLYYPATGNKGPCKIVGYNWLGQGEH